MGLSKTDVCSQALLRVGADIIESLDVNVGDPEGTVETALLCNVLFDQAFDELLRMYPWNCCTARDVPVKLAEAPAFGYTTAFQVPNDFVRLLPIGSRAGSGPTDYTQNFFKKPTLIP